MNDSQEAIGFDSPEEVVFELTQDVISAKKQIKDIKKLLLESEEASADFKELAMIDPDHEERTRWQQALEKSIKLQGMYKARIGTLEDALVVLEKTILRLKT